MTLEQSLQQVTAGFRQLGDAAAHAAKAFAAWNAIFEDRDKFHAVYPGQWPDEFAVLNRFMRTGLRPPFILND